ncbi:putative aspartic peptidase A1 family, aspartic peptidase domain superfamily, xylanase inhibitor [Helianthus anomalus]
MAGPSPSCQVPQQNPNPITGDTAFGDLAEDIVSVDGMTPEIFLFSCSPEYLVKGSVNSAKGVLGFGRSKVAFQSQMVNAFDFPRKFIVCLSSSDGFIISGAGISKSLSYTPLMSVDRCYLNVNSINTAAATTSTAEESFSLVKNNPLNFGMIIRLTPILNFSVGLIYLTL